MKQFSKNYLNNANTSANPGFGARAFAVVHFYRKT